MPLSLSLSHTHTHTHTHTHNVAIATHEQTTLLLTGNMQQPGVTFAYDYAAMEVNHVESREGLGSFIGSLCAVVGGVFVTTGLLFSGAKAAVGGKKLD